MPLKVRTTSSQFAATLDHLELVPGVSVTRVASTGSEVYRNAAVIADSPRDDLLLSVHRVGRGSVFQNEREAMLRDGRAALYDASTPYVLGFPGRMSEVVLQVPRRTVGSIGHSFADLTARVLPETAGMTALQGLLWSIDPSRGGENEDAENELIAEAMLSLLQAALLPRDRPVRISGGALARALRSYADEHLAESDLTPERLAAQHHVSVRLVHKVFAEQQDSPAGYIRRRRLERARVMLDEGATVAAAAYRWGFSDADTFTRAFKRHYGHTPSARRGRDSAPETSVPR